MYTDEVRVALVIFFVFTENDSVKVIKLSQVKFHPGQR